MPVPAGTTTPEPEPISTGRLLLIPVDTATARDLVDGRTAAALERAGLVAAPAWPHADTLDGLRGVLDGATAWLVTLDGAVIGDCGTAGPVAADGTIEIGYGLAAPYRGRGFGTEVVPALSGWLLRQTTVQRVVAEVEEGNIPSIRVLSGAGFVRQADPATAATADASGPALYRYVLAGPSGT